MFPPLQQPVLVLVVDDALRGVQLVDLLARELPKAHHAALRQLVGGGSVSVNGEVCLSSRRLRTGDVVMVGALGGQAVEVPQFSPPAAAALPAVLYESAAAMVVQKPAGLTVVPDRSGQERGLHGVLAQLRPGGDLRIVHRLDRDTSGCLLLADGLDAARHFDLQFRSAAVAKVYLGFVLGVPAADEFAITAWLGPDPARPGKVISSPVERKGFRAAHTDVRVKTRYGRGALLELHPRTGRSHQLRVHLQSVGLSLAGDRDYGGEPLLLSAWKRGYKLRPGVVERPLLDRMFLHAASLSFVDPVAGRVTVAAPLPDDLAMALQKLERFDESRR